MKTVMQTMNAGSVVTFQDEFVGRGFCGTGRTVKGTFVSARFCGFGNRKVEVTFRPDKPGPLGPLDVTEFPGGATLRFAL